MPTADRRRFVPAAIRLFLAQDYRDKELVVVDDGIESAADLMPADARIRYIRSKPGRRLGDKRNLACEAARGEIILHWDDDDWYAPWRVSSQVEFLEAHALDVCGLDRAFFVDAERERAWEYVHSAVELRRWVCGATLCYRKSVWELHPFPNVNAGEDTRFVVACRTARIRAVEDNRCFVARIHAANSSPKHTRNPRWEPRSFDSVRRLVAADWEPCFGGERGLPLLPRQKVGEALVSAASGIGDILRVTPLVRAANRLGYDVDVLVSPDNPAAADLLAGAPEIRELIVCADVLRNGGRRPVEQLRGRRYDVATFTRLSAPLIRWVKAGVCYTFEPGWRADGDAAAIGKIARQMGWQAELPAPFAMRSARDFGLPRGTVALHPGCKPNWPWKKWHGFDDLARQFRDVAIVGTASDLENEQTYFARPFAWPDHVIDFVGKLDLRDTAALIAQCAALISLDSGLMHLGVALGVPTFGVFGITSPERECLPSALLRPITKRLPCEPACRRAPWGRRDCERHLECLKTLTAEEVAARAAAELPNLVRRDTHAAPIVHPERITLNYFGEVSAASGYGQAARAYVRALHLAGVDVRVIDIGGRPQYFPDQLIASLLGRHANPDFSLFHGIPSFWGRQARLLPNVIAMTVWEADRIPQIWQRTLAAAVDVWVPSAFTVDVFERDLQKPPFRLPHALLSPAAVAELDIGVVADDFVFYSIFEWQDRKNPYGLIESYLRAFPDETDTALVIKTGIRASEAHSLLERLRAQTGSSARVTLCCDPFDQAQIAALHARGDCYVSLHRGEGWGYPLFEAAAAGKPIVATAYGGPLDYLDDKSHWLVRHTMLPVQRPYFLYRSNMRWAEPDLEHAREGFRWVYEHRAEAQSRAELAAVDLRTRFSLERIGEAAKARLLELKHAILKPVAVGPQPVTAHTVTPLPIPGEWYDADYFERGVKSNWRGGYTWPLFKGLFRETAALLHVAFPEAVSYLDAGCAKGFLVQALRECGLDARGFDHSPWAINNAHPGAAEFLELVPLQEARYGDRTIDVLVAMSLLESLTEEQIAHFLRRARGWVREAIFATVPSISADDRDRSHVTLHERTWWDGRFAEAGWRRHALQTTLERHRLPLRMKWNVFVLEPAS